MGHPSHNRELFILIHLKRWWEREQYLCSEGRFSQGYGAFFIFEIKTIIRFSMAIIPTSMRCGKEWLLWQLHGPNPTGTTQTLWCPFTIRIGRPLFLALKRRYFYCFDNSFACMVAFGLTPLEDVLFSIFVTLFLSILNKISSIRKKLKQRRHIFVDLINLVCVWLLLVWLLEEDVLSSILVIPFLSTLNKISSSIRRKKD